MEITIDERERLNRLGKIKMIGYVIASLALIYTFFHTTSGGMITPALVEKFNLTPARAALIGAVWFYATAAAAIPGGLLIDYIGARRSMAVLYTLMSIGTLALVVFQNNFTAILVGRALIAMGALSVYTAIIKLIAGWESREGFAYVNGTVAAIGRLGAMLATTPLALMLTNLGWGNTFLTLGILAAIITVSIFLLVKDSPRDAGLIPTEQSSAEVPKREVTNPLAGLGVLLKQPQYGLFLVFAIINATIYQTLFAGWGGVILKQVLKINIVTAGNILLTGSFGTLIGAYVAGYVASKKGAKFTNIIAHAITMIIIITFALTLKRATTLEQATIIAMMFALFGGFSFSTSVGVNAGIALLRTLVGPRYIGTARSTQVLLQNLLGSGAMIQTWGVIIQKGGGYVPAAFSTAMNVLFIVALIALIALILIREQPIKALEE
ncbi:MFS transporter [Neomoorella mulderi]|uniref:L-galactonate transporter n=1 Tax=Moorella mulderi DSM 14980 TaxID=1122241 RepID=A0A151AW89_9FIRM|nr:MFS transporter [Moorella mulderi]KYH31916.1 L-galactonate transporter [Moorella mulderi DSM 14980]